MSLKIRLLLFSLLLSTSIHLASCLAEEKIPSSVQGPLKGIDVSHFQGVVQWKKVAKNKIYFAIAKATGGETYVDPQFATNWHGMRANNIIRGAYHFFYAHDDPEKQARNYLDQLGILKPTDLPPILDIEILDHVSADVLRKGVLRWLEIVEKETKRKPIVYTNPSFAQQYLADVKLSEYPLWIASYSPKLDVLPFPWQGKCWSLWQYSSHGKVAGIQGYVDMDKYNGNLSDLKHFIKDTLL